MNQIEKAVIFATEAHSGQKRKIENYPYVFHVVEVGNIVATITSKEEVIIAGILHDTLEDTKTTPEDIEKNFGHEVLRLVKGETENRSYTISKSASWVMRKQEMIDYIQGASLDEKIICLADKLSNIRSMKRSFVKFGDKFYDYFNQKDPKMHEWYFRSLLAAMPELKDELAYKELEELIDIVFGGNK